MIKMVDLISEVKTVKVPKFKTSKQVTDFLKSIPATAKVDNDIWDPQTGEVYMEKGQSKAKLSKKQYKQLSPELTPIDWFTFLDRNDRKDFEKFFNVIYRDFGKGLSDDEKEMYTSGDYEWEFEYPSKIKRKDGKPFTQNDVNNIEYFAEWYSKNVLSYGAKLSVYVKEGNKMAEPEVQFG